MVLEKKPLSLDELNAQTALELPDRALPLVNVVVTDVLNDLTINVTVEDVDVAVQICAALNLIAETGNVTIDCVIE